MSDQKPCSVVPGRSWCHEHDESAGDSGICIVVLEERIAGWESRALAAEERAAEAEAKQRIDQAQCDEMTTLAGDLAAKLRAAEERVKVADAAVRVARGLYEHNKAKREAAEERARLLEEALRGLREWAAGEISRRDRRQDGDYPHAIAFARQAIRGVLGNLLDRMDSALSPQPAEPPSEQEAK